MVHILRFLAAALATAVAAAGTAASAQDAPGPGSRSPAPAPTTAAAASASAATALLDATLFYEILVGEILVRNGDPGSGYSLLLEAARRSRDEHLFQRAADIALQSRSGDAALVAALAWKEAWPRSRQANQYVLQILVALNRTEETAAPLRQEVDSMPAPAKASALLALPQLYRRASDKALAATVVEKALAGELADPATGPAAWTAVGRMRLWAGDKQGALAAAQRGHTQDPGSEGPAVLALELLEGGVAQAEPLLQRHLAGQPSPELRMAYARLLLELQRHAEAQMQLQAVTAQKPDLAQAWLVQAALLVQDNQLAQAEASVQRFLALSSPGQENDAARSALTQAFLISAQIAEKRGDFAGAESWLARIENEKDLFTTQTRRASLLARQGKLAHARALLRSMPAPTDEARRMVMLAEVQLLRDAREFREAYALQEQVVAQAPQDDDLVYELAMLADKTRDYKAMERLLRQIIERKPGYHHAYNALGYSLAERGVRLSEARELVKKALEYAPNDPFITDSLGWVEFRMGHLEVARGLLEGAYKARPHAEIAAHLGEVLWALGDKSAARRIWSEGVQLDAQDETLRETLQRFGVKP